jgi:uncharacterized protein YdcH (DUF465 family)
LKYEKIKNCKEAVMTDEEIVEQLRAGNEIFKKLEEEHRVLDLQIDEFDKKKYLTSEEAYSRKALQKEKLFKKDRMAEMIREFKKFAD